MGALTPMYDAMNSRTLKGLRRKAFMPLKRTKIVQPTKP
jgi:hypothetical protein